MKGTRAGMLVVTIPEGVQIAFKLAGNISRFAAWFLDVLIMAALTTAAQRVLSVVAVVSRQGAQAFAVVAFFVVFTGYAMFCEWRWRGQTIGKRLLRLRVMDAQGLQLTLPQIVIRNLIRFFDFLPGAYLVGGMVAVFTRHGQRLGDLSAGTVVIREERSRGRTLPSLAVAFNSLAAYPHLVARLRHGTSRELIDIAALALHRRDELEPVARVSLFDEIRDHFQAIAAFPDAAVEYLTSEQYVRNVLAAFVAKR